MTDSLYRCQRAILVRQVPQEQIESALKRFVPYTGRKKRIRLALSGEHDGWRILGVAEPISTAMLVELAWTILDSEENEDFDLDKLAQEPDISDDAVVVVQWIPEDPSQSWYATLEPSDQFEVVFIGRRENGTAWRLDVVEEKMQDFQDPLSVPSLFAYLQQRQVPTVFHPMEAGFAFEPVRLLPITINVDE